MANLSSSLLPDRLREYLDHQGVPYTLLPERTGALSSQPATTDLQVQVVGVGDDYALWLTAVQEDVPPSGWPALLARALGRAVRPASESEVRLLLPDCDPHWAPPFGPAYGLPVYASETLSRVEEKVNCPAGHAGVRICVSRTALEQFAAVTWLTF